MIVTTTPTIEGRPAKEYLGVVTGEVIVGANLVRDLFASITDIVGGRTAFEGFAKAYIGAFKMKTLTSADFRDFFLQWCDAQEVDASGVDWEAWLTLPGMPVVPKSFPDPLGASGTRLAERWLAEHPEASAFC